MPNKASCSTVSSEPWSPLHMSSRVEQTPRSSPPKSTTVESTPDITPSIQPNISISSAPPRPGGFSWFKLAGSRPLQFWQSTLSAARWGSAV
ncbi:hypothetical protein BKA81DRAFT_343724 [Phyllosticta paracitricarpa]